VKVLVTGGSGTLGQAVCRILDGAGHQRFVYDLTAPETADGFDQGDIRDGLRLLDVARSRGADAVVHLASLLTPESSADPAAAVAINSGGMVNALEVSRQLGLSRFVWASSAGVFKGYPRGTPIPNDAPYRPQTVYDGTKILNEMLATHYHDSLGLETVGLRFPTMLGEFKQRGRSGMVSREMIEKPLRGEVGWLPFGSGGSNFLWIEDAAQALVVALTGPTTQSRHLSVSGDRRTLEDALAITKSLIPDARIELGDEVWGRDAMLEDDVIERELGFRATWKLEDQLRTIVERMRERSQATNSAG
jgi:nucleoside-diphosphate-sugar epimerase